MGMEVIAIKPRYAALWKDCIPQNLDQTIVREKGGEISRCVVERSRVYNQINPHLERIQQPLLRNMMIAF